MAASVIAEQLQALLEAKGWRSDARRFTVASEEPALDPIEHFWMAGDAKSITDGEILQVRPTRIVVQDLAPTDELRRLKAAMTSSGRDANVYTFTRFIDILWDAKTAAHRALRDAETTDADTGFSFHISDPNVRHVEQQVEYDGRMVADHRLLQAAMPEGSGCLAVLADAGLGKSELLKWHEWRHAVLYQSASSQGSPSLPSIALRVPLRGLRSLSLDAIAHYLSHPVQEERLPALRFIESGGFLRELLRLQRVLLLLDGVDELSLDAVKLDEGLLDLRRVVAYGGRIVLSSRAGHAASRGSLSNRFDSSEIGHIEPLTRPLAKALLLKYGAEDARAEEILAALADSPARGIPLFLLLAHQVDLKGPLTPEVLESRTRVLLQLLELFCSRDEERLGLSSQEQMNFLTSVAQWTLLDGPQTQSELIDLLGLDEEDPAVAIVKNPHALLTVDNSGTVSFKHPQFYSLFSAKAIAEDWRAFGFESIRDVLAGQELGDSSLDYLARLISNELIAGAWASTELDARNRPALLVRRNLLGLALAIVSDTAHSGSPRARSEALSKALGSRSLTDAGLAGLFLERFDFADWVIRRIQGRRGSLRYCTNLDKVDHDETVNSISSIEGCSFNENRTEKNLESGVRRLKHLSRPLRRKQGGGFINLMNVEEARDSGAWEILAKRGLASKEGRAGAAKWVLNQEGLRMIATLAVTPEDHQDLERLLGEDLALRGLVEALS